VLQEERTDSRAARELGGGAGEPGPARPGPAERPPPPHPPTARRASPRPHGLRALPAPQPIAVGGRARALIDAERSARGTWGRSKAPRPALRTPFCPSSGRGEVGAGSCGYRCGGGHGGRGLRRFPSAPVRGPRLVNIKVEGPSGAGRPGQGCSMNTCPSSPSLPPPVPARVAGSDSP